MTGHTGNSAAILKISALILAAQMWCTPLFAADPPVAGKGEIIFLKAKVKAISGKYLALKTVNVRSRPHSKGRRTGKLKTGEIVDGVGIAKGPWVAIRKDGKDLGFTYGQFLLPIINGSLSDSIKGNLTASSDWKCDYLVEFVGKSPIDDKPYEISDYDVSWDCVTGQRQLSFLTPMFMTEVPYNMGFKAVYQVTLDIIDFDSIGEDIFSTTLFYNRDKQQVVFDRVSNDKFGKTPEPKMVSVTSIEEVIKTSVEIAFRSWTNDLWRDLAKLH